MATLTKEQNEALNQQLTQLNEKANAVNDELAEDGAVELSEDELDKAAGGRFGDIFNDDWFSQYDTSTPDLDGPPPPDYPTLPN